MNPRWSAGTVAALRARHPRLLVVGLSLLGVMAVTGPAVLADDALPPAAAGGPGSPPAVRQPAGVPAATGRPDDATGRPDDATGTLVEAAAPPAAPSIRTPLGPQTSAAAASPFAVATGPVLALRAAPAAGALTGAALSAARRTAAALTRVSLSQVSLPSTVFAAYRRAERTTKRTDPTCHLSWSLLAGIGQVESGQARGGRVDTTGRTLTPIIGPALDGAPGTARIGDSDGGALDGDTVWDHAVGPMQFIPSTWRYAGADGNGDGIRDPHNVNDAALAAAGYLCAGGGDLRQPAALRSAVLSYNHSDAYADLVLAYATAYATGRPVVLPVVVSTVPAAAVPSPTGSPTATPVVTPTATPVVTPTATPVVTPTVTPVVTPTAKPTVLVTPAAKPSPTATQTAKPTPTAKPTLTPTATPTTPMTPTPTATPAPTATPTATPTPTATTAAPSSTPSDVSPAAPATTSAAPVVPTP